MYQPVNFSRTLMNFTLFDLTNATEWLNKIQEDYNINCESTKLE